MFPLTIVVHLNVVKYFKPCFISRLVPAMIDQFGLQCLKETLSHCIVPAITSAALAIKAEQVMSLICSRIDIGTFGYLVVFNHALTILLVGSKDSLCQLVIFCSYLRG